MVVARDWGKLGKWGVTVNEHEVSDESAVEVCCATSSLWSAAMCCPLKYLLRG